MNPCVLVGSSEAAGVSVTLTRPRGSLPVLLPVVSAVNRRGEAPRQPSGMLKEPSGRQTSSQERRTSNTARASRKGGGAPIDGAA